MLASPSIFFAQQRVSIKGRNPSLVYRCRASPPAWAPRNMLLYLSASRSGPPPSLRSLCKPVTPRYPGGIGEKRNGVLGQFTRLVHICAHLLPAENAR